MLVDAARGGDEQASAASTPAATSAPAGATAAGALVVGDAAAPVRVEIFLDYMCPYCGRFERANGGELARLVTAGTARLEMYPLSFLDRMSRGSEYSTRTANAAATVADAAPDKLLAFTAALYEHQPEENTAGLTDDQIADLAQTAGVPADVAARFAARSFGPWVAASTEKVLASGINGTPTVRINGEVFRGDLYTVGALTDAITAQVG
jgi:protein-disulfide isomerase